MGLLCVLSYFARCNGTRPSSSKRLRREQASGKINMKNHNNVLYFDLDDGSLSSFLPLLDSSGCPPRLPSQLHPSSGLVPGNWEEFPVDESIPDVGGWSPRQVCDYLTEQGMAEHVAQIFPREVSLVALVSTL